MVVLGSGVVVLGSGVFGLVGLDSVKLDYVRFQ